MIASIFTLALASLATAAPSGSPPKPNQYPPTQTSKGFQLVVNVTDPSTDFKPAIHHSYVASIHVGAGLNRVGQTNDKKYARTFYVNGTETDVHFGKSHMISDAGSMPEGFGLAPVDGSNNIKDLSLNGGSGDSGIVLTRKPAHEIYLNPGTVMACKESLKYYSDKEFVVIKQIDPSADDKMPDNCIKVNLIPECHKLDALPEGAKWNHDNAADSSCYKNVAQLKWP